MRAFIAQGGRARWDFIVFGHNEHQVDEAKQLAESWGVERFQLKKSGRFFTASNRGKDKHQAQNRKGVETQLIEKPKQLDNQNLALLKQKEIEKTYGSMKDYYDSCSIKCKAVEKKEIFVTAEGLLMPCCWTAGRMYKWWHKDPRVEQIWDFIDGAGGKAAIDIKENDIQKVMEGPLLSNITNSWSIDGVTQGKLGVCAMKCGTEFDPFAEQFK